MGIVNNIKDGRLILSGCINERLPMVVDDLVASYPMDGSLKGIDNSPIMDYSVWEVGQIGDIGDFSAVLSNDSNTRVLAEDPWGNMSVIWQASTSSNPTYPSEGGVYHNSHAIDNTKKYRLSWWERRVTNNGATHGRYYFGCNGYGGVNGVKYINSSSVSTNPYFWSCDYDHWILETHEWFLIVAHIHEYGTPETTNDPDSGIYNVKGERLSGISKDYVWLDSTTTGRSRTLSIYRGDVAGMVHHSCCPRMDICDGSEPSLEDLITGNLQVQNVSSESNVVKQYSGTAIEGATTNLVDSGQRTCSIALDRMSGHVETWTYELKTNFYGRDDVIRLFIDPVAAPYADFGFGDIGYDNVGDILHVSFDYYIINGPNEPVLNTIYANGYKSPDSSGAATKTLLATLDLKNGWKRRLYKIEKTIAGNSWYRFHLGSSGEFTDALVDNFQVEKQNYATSFYDGTRSASSGIKINVNGGLTENITEYTIMGMFLPRTPFEDGSDPYVLTPNNAALIHIKDTLNVGNVYYRYYSSSDTSAPFLDPDGNYNTSGGSGHIHQSYTIDTNEWLYFVLRKTSTTLKFKIYQGGWKTEHTMTVPSDAQLDEIYFGDDTLWEGVYKNISIYQKNLSDDEVAANVSLIETSNDEEVCFEELLEMEGWVHVYGGPHFYLSDQSPHDAIDYEHPGSDALVFDMMMIKPRYFGDTDDYPFTIGTFSEACVMKEPYRYYTDALDGEPNVSGTKLKCHSLDDGLLDVEANTSHLGYCYGNSWRRYGIMWFTGGTSSYLAAYDDYGINYNEWGANYADNYANETEMLNDILTESNLGLTPLKSCMIDVYVKTGTETAFSKEHGSSGLILKREVIEEGI